MALIVAGYILIKAGQRDAFVARSSEAVGLARTAGGCFDFAVSPDPIDPDRVNVFERWESREKLLGFRGEGPGEDLSQLIAKAVVKEYAIES